MIMEELKRGVLRENPVLGQALGLCPALAVTSTALNAVGMGLAVLGVLICSNIVVSLVSKWIPEKVRPLCFTVIIAAAVTIVDVAMKAVCPALSSRLGIFVPLIAANCIVITRAGLFASKNNAFRSALDGVGMGLGFALSLVLIAAVRELLGNNTVFGLTAIPGFHPLLLFVYAPGGFFVLAAILWIVNLRRLKKETGDQ
jgi:Na+-translocating ferredoxin:NAD+ oxidoreductase subunit E